MTRFEATAAEILQITIRTPNGRYGKIGRVVGEEARIEFSTDPDGSQWYLVDYLTATSPIDFAAAERAALQDI